MDAFAYGETGGSGEIITENALCSGIQLHMGSEFSLYKTDLGQQLYPAYIIQKIYHRIHRIQFNQKHSLMIFILR